MPHYPRMMADRKYQVSQIARDRPSFQALLESSMHVCIMLSDRTLPLRRLMALG